VPLGIAVGERHRIERARRHAARGGVTDHERDVGIPGAVGGHRRLGVQHEVYLLYAGGFARPRVSRVLDAKALLRVGRGQTHLDRTPLVAGDGLGAERIPRADVRVGAGPAHLDLNAPVRAPVASRARLRRSEADHVVILRGIRKGIERAIELIDGVGHERPVGLRCKAAEWRQTILGFGELFAADRFRGARIG
jgi:hypothetical protein